MSIVDSSYLNEIGKAWSTMTDQEKIITSLELCGIRKMNKFMVFMDEYVKEDTIKSSKVLLDKVNYYTLRDSKDLTQRGLKCSEEVGELAQAILSYTNACGCSYKKLGVDKVLEEAIDVIIVALSIVCSIDGGIENFDKEFEAKLLKWDTKINGHEIKWNKD